MTTSTTAASGASSLTAAQSTLAQAQSQTASSAQQLAGNMQTFLQLLTTQLKYQDPSAPMDTSQFTSQLVQYASVEQEININQNLETMLANQDNSSMATAANYIGAVATGTSNSLPLQNGLAQFEYTTPANTKAVNIVVSDSSGNIVDTMNGTAAAGTYVQQWDGTNIYGGKAADGTYGVQITAVANDGSTQTLTPAVSGTVTGVATDTSNNQTELFLGGVGIDLSKILEVQAPGSIKASTTGGSGTSTSGGTSTSSTTGSSATGG